jgi:hypothetical protein
MMNLTEDNINQIRNFLELSKLNMVGDYGRWCKRAVIEDPVWIY